MRRKTVETFLLIVALAAIVRLAGIDRFPPGLWADEGLNGVDAWWTLHTGGPDGSGPHLVYPDVFPREPLFVWLLSIALWLGGPRVIVMRLLVVLIGSLACGTFFLAVQVSQRRLGPQNDAPPPQAPYRLALVAAFVLATMHWHAHFSRLVFRTSLVPLVTTAALAAMAWAARSTRTRHSRTGAWAIAGAIAGIGFYTYLSWYFFLPVLLLWLLSFGAFRKISPVAEAPRMRSILYFLFGAAIVALPLYIHYALHPEHLTGRPTEVSPLRDGLGPATKLIARNLRDVLLMFFVRGDHVPKHNIPWTPVLDPAWAILFVAGIVRAVLAMHRRSPLSPIVQAWLAWLVCMSMPSVLSQTDSANTLRNLGAAPAIAWFIAFGWQGLGAFTRRLPAQSARIASFLLLAALLWGAGFQVDKLWRRHPQVEGIANSFNILHVELAAMCVPAPDDAPIFIPTDFLTHKTFQFLTIGRHDLRPLASTSLLTRETRPRDHRVLCTMLSANYSLLRQRFPRATIEKPMLQMGDQPFAWIVRIPAGDLLPPDKAANAAELLPLQTQR